MKKIMPLQTPTLQFPRAQQSSTLPMQSSTIPAQTAEGGIDITALMNLMITMMIVVMMMKIMSGMMTGLND